MFNDAVEQTVPLLAAKRRQNAAHGVKPWEKWKTEKPQRGERLVLTHTLSPLRSILKRSFVLQNLSLFEQSPPRRHATLVTNFCREKWVLCESNQDKYVS